jgi:hypothetical protein
MAGSSSRLEVFSALTRQSDAALAIAIRYRVDMLVNGGTEFGYRMRNSESFAPQTDASVGDACISRVCFKSP